MHTHTCSCVGAIFEPSKVEIPPTCHPKSMWQSAIDPHCASPTMCHLHSFPPRTSYLLDGPTSQVFGFMQMWKEGYEWREIKGFVLCNLHEDVKDLIALQVKNME
jgi:hypothetical protein